MYWFILGPAKTSQPSHASSQVRCHFSAYTRWVHASRKARDPVRDANGAPPSNRNRNTRHCFCIISSLHAVNASESHQALESGSRWLQGESSKCPWHTRMLGCQGLECYGKSSSLYHLFAWLRSQVRHYTIYEVVCCCLFVFCFFCFFKGSGAEMKQVINTVALPSCSGFIFLVLILLTKMRILITESECYEVC